MEMKNGKVPILDIYLASFLSLQGVDPQFSKQGTRVVFEFPATAEVYRLTKKYNQSDVLSGFAHLLFPLQHENERTNE